MAMNQCASVSAPEPRLLVVTPFDKGQIEGDREGDPRIEPRARSRRIQGGVIRVPLPAMNEQRRKELAKTVHKYAEDGRIAVRHARTMRATS
jgi:ribosome recycling factor